MYETIAPTQGIVQELGEMHACDSAACVVQQLRYNDSELQLAVLL